MLKKVNTILLSSFLCNPADNPTNQQINGRYKTNSLAEAKMQMVSWWKTIWHIHVDGIYE